MFKAAINLPKGTLINSPQDLEWLRDVHVSNLPNNVRSAFIVGNEDCPDQIWLSQKTFPNDSTLFECAFYRAVF